MSKTSLFFFTFESFIYNFLLEDIQDKINPNELRFKPNHSTMRCLIYMLETILKHFELNGSYAEAVSADSSKVFDNLDHQTVIDNARALGARDFVLHMVTSFCLTVHNV